MQGTQDPRFSPTLWPSDFRRLPPVAIYDDPYAMSRAQVGMRDLPEDFVLQEVLTVDEERFDAFSAEWGSFAWGTKTDRNSGLLGLTILQALSRHFLAAVEQDDEAILEVWNAALVEQDSGASQSVEAAWRRWEHHLNEALRAFTVYIRVDATDRGERIIDIQRRTTFEVAALQLAQIASEGRAVGRCASETCGRPFTVQRSARRMYEGTAHIQGVKYCSRSCAKAQGERERRRRLRANDLT